jgi:hypothetical protein
MCHQSAPLARRLWALGFNRFAVTFQLDKKYLPHAAKPPSTRIVVPVM